MTGQGDGVTNRPRGSSGLVLWFAGGAGVAVCALLLLLWGINGPTYIFDLIAAFCG
jgi:hypothetical protein